MAYKDSYLPIDPDFLEIIQEVADKKKFEKVHFFNEKEEVDDAIGNIVEIQKTDEGVFLLLSDSDKIRLDKIITLYGRPGPAYDQYDAFANACLACEDLGQF